MILNVLRVVLFAKGAPAVCSVAAGAFLLENTTMTDSLPTVPFTGMRTLQELSFRQRYRIAEFDCRHYTFNREGRLEKICIFLEWARSRSSNRKGLCTDVPLRLEADALRLKGFNKRDAERFRRWANENKFIIASNNGDYVPFNKAKTYYVNHARINAFFSLLREKGLLPKGSKWKRTLDNPENTVLLEKAARKTSNSRLSKTEKDWVESIENVKIYGNMCIPLVRSGKLSVEDRAAAVIAKAIQNSPMYRTTKDICDAYNKLICSKSCSDYTTTLSTPLLPPTTPSSSSTLLPYPPWSHFPNGETLRISTILSRFSHKVTKSGGDLEGVFENSENRVKNGVEIPGNGGLLPLLLLSCHVNPRLSANYCITGISYRVYSGAALLKSHDTSDHGKWETSERKLALDALFGIGGYERIDRRASIHHLTMCLHSGTYCDGHSLDLYGDVYRDAFGCELVDRASFKMSLSRIYFTPSERLYACQVMRSEGCFDEARRTMLVEEHRQVMDAYVGRCGNPLGAEIFAYESLLMVLVQYRLLERHGLRSCNIYDELVVENGGFTQEQLVELVEGISRDVFPILLDFFGRQDGVM